MNSAIPILVTSIPALRYADPDRAIQWLKDALGFSEMVVYRNAAGVVEHAELTLGNGMVMIGTAGHDLQTAHWFTQPHTVGAVTGSVYLVVQNCAQIYSKAQSVGAEVLQELEIKSYGGKAFIVRDPEGQIWSVGEYNPWTRSTDI